MIYPFLIVRVRKWKKMKSPNKLMVVRVNRSSKYQS
jgi:hypothetical protein